MSRRPRPRYQTRFMRGPSSASAFFTYRFSIVMLKLFSAFAIAERTTRPIWRLEPLDRCSRMAMASPTGLPLMSSVTRRALRGENRWNFAEAVTSINRPSVPARRRPEPRPPRVRPERRSRASLRPLGDEAIRARIPARLETHGRLAPRRLRHATDGRLRLATAVRVVARRHHDATHRGTPAHAPLVAGASDLLVLVFDVAELADRRAATHLHDADGARRQPDMRVLAFLRDQLRHAAGRAHHLRAAARLELDPVDRRAGRDVLEREAVAH